MSETGDLEELAQVVHEGFLGLTGDVYDWEDEDIARAVLKSVWLAEHDAATRTAALEEAAVIADGIDDDALYPSLIGNAIRAAK